MRRKLSKKLATYFSYFGAGVALALSAELEVASSMGTNEVVEQVAADYMVERWRQG